MCFVQGGGLDALPIREIKRRLQAAGIPVVRVGTYTGLYSAGTKTSYARAHHGIEAFVWCSF